LASEVPEGPAWARNQDNHIYGEQLKKTCIGAPPKAEQAVIAEHIQQGASNANSLIIRIQSEINLIREYRIRLVSDVVTGKVDARHLAPPSGSVELDDVDGGVDALYEDSGDPKLYLSDGELKNER
jgi:type I restriction enzyme, S subunit